MATNPFSEQSARCRLSRTAALSALGCFLLLSSPALCLGPDTAGGICASAVPGTPATAHPGGRVELSFRVTNGTSGEAELADSLRVPPGWRAFPTPAFTLRPGETLIRTVALEVAADAPDGRYEIAYCAQGLRGIAVRGATSTRVEVAQGGKPRLKCPGESDLAEAPGNHPEDRTPTHTGEAAAQVRLSIGGLSGPSPTRESEQPASTANPSRAEIQDPVDQSKGHGVEARAVSARVTDALPGEIVSFSFRVTSHAPGEEEFTESLRLPPGWQPIIPQGTFVLGKGQEQLRVVAFAVAQGAPEGRYEIAYTVRSVRDYAMRDAETVTVVVPTVGDLVLLVEEKPDTIVAGDEYEARLRLLNKGNATVGVTFQAKSEEKYPASVAPAEATLGPHTAEVVVLRVETDPAEARWTQHTVQVIARSEAEGGMRAGATLSVEVVPKVTGKADLRQRVPGQLVLKAMGDGDGSAFQAELSGAGTLDEAGSRAIDFLLRAPDAGEIGVFGERDESRLSYTTPGFSVNVGDRSFALSRLTDYYRYGRGLEVCARPEDGGAEAGAFYVQSRWIRPQTHETGLHVGGSFGEGFQAKLNFLRKGQGGQGAEPGSNDELWSLECALKPWDQADVHLEYALSQSDRIGAGADHAYLVECTGALGDEAHYSLSKIHAGPDYYGYYRDTDYTLAAVGVPLGSRLRALGSYQAWKQNLDLRPERGGAPSERLWRAGIRYSLPSGWYATLDYNDLRYRDPLRASAFDAEERPLRIAIGRSAADYNVRLEFWGGRRRDLTTGIAHEMRNCALYASYRSSPRLSFTVYCQLGDGREDGSRLLGAADNLGASLGWQPTENFFLSLYYLKYDLNTGERDDGDQAQLRASYFFSDGSSLTLEGRRSNRSVGGRGEDTYAVSYAIPLSIPAGRKESVGAIAGKVFDAARPDQPGIAGAILTANGAAAVTDENGRFVFPALPPGTYSLQIDRRSIGLGRVTERRTPIPVDVEGGRETEVAIGIASASTLSGRVVVAPSGSSGEPGRGAEPGGSGFYIVGDPEHRANGDEPDGLSNVLLELNDDDEILRRVTDRNGDFVFEGVRPGAWHLRISEAGLPPYHEIEEPETEIQLEPGEAEQIAIKVVPRIRRIRMIEDGQAGSGTPIEPTPSGDPAQAPGR
jgi:hypothetical protein